MALEGHALWTDSDGTASPFDEIPLDFDNQTGADWYAMMLTASFGGKQVHGHNFTPSCETLSKVSFDAASRQCHGKIRIDKRVTAVEPYSTDTKYAQYSGRAFRGVKTLAASYLAYDSGNWEPSSRKRAKATAKLAAGIALSTGSVEEGCRVASIVSGSVVPQEVVSNTMLPLSVFRRDVAALHTTDQRLYSTVNWQRAVVWEDQNLASEKMSPHAAVDWGRITTIARYIGEANAKYDPKFCYVAEKVGVPYQIVRGAWAYVTDNDYDASTFSVPPELQLKYLPKHIPKLEHAYKDHVESLVLALRGQSEYLDSDNCSKQAEQILRLLENIRVKPAKSKWVSSTGTDIIGELKSHSFSVQRDSARMSAASTAADAYYEIAAELVSNSPQLRQLARNIVTSAKIGVSATGDLNVVASRVMRHDVWVLAHNLLARRLDSPSLAQERLAKLKRSFTGSSVPWGVDLGLSAIARMASRAPVITVCKRALLPAVPVIEGPLVLPTARQMEAVGAYQRAAAFARKHIDETARAWSKRYEAWSRTWAKSETPGRQEKAVRYSALAAAFGAITVDSVLSPTTGYTDTSNPANTYLGRMAKNYARKRRLTMPRLPCTPMASMSEIALLLDNQYNPSVKFADVEKLVRDRLKMFAEDLVQEVEPREGAVEEPPAVVVRVKKEVDEEKRRKARELYEFMMSMSYNPDAPKTINDVLKSYQSIDIAERHAVANGYKTFQAAFDALGEKARYDEETDFTRKGMAADRAVEERVSEEEQPVIV